MFLWDTPAGLRAFGNTGEVAAASKVLAASCKMLYVPAPPAAIALVLVMLS